MKIEKARLSELNLDMNNLRGHKESEVELLKKSLTIFGQYKPLIVDRATMTVKIGNGRLMAMRQLGWTECDCVFVDDWSDKAGMEVMDNRLNELSSWVDSGLGKWFKDKGTDWWGVDDEISGKLERLAEKAAKAGEKKPKGEKDPDGAAEQPQGPVCPNCGKPLVKKKRMQID